MNEGNLDTLKEINEFVADCAKSILLNNVKADDILNKIKLLNESIINELNNEANKNNLNTKNIINNITECQKQISILINQNNINNQELNRELVKKLSQYAEDIKSNVVFEADRIDKIITKFQGNTQMQHESLTNNILKQIGYNAININNVQQYLVDKSRFLPWITVGIYLTFVVLVIFAVITLRHLGIIHF